MTEVSELLRAARQRIANPERWTQGVLARNSDGKEVNSLSDSAVRWCANGACFAVSRKGNAWLKVCAYLRSAARELYGCPEMSKVNDYGTHADVLRCFDRAIELAEVVGDD